MSNPYRLIKQLAILTGVFMVAATSVRAQQSSYYIYIQSDNGQPFYTQIGDKVYSSSNAGHLIIAGLKDNVCNLEIGFPQHTSRPQQFSIPVKGKDHGFQLRKNGSQEWALYNWQNQETIKPQKGSGTSDLLYGERKKDDAFATLMAAVVNDSAVLYTSIVKNDVPEAAPVTAKVTKKEEKKEERKEEKKEDKKEETKPSLIQLPVNDVGSMSVTVSYDTNATVARVERTDLDSARVYKTDKPLFDTAKLAYKNDKPLFDTSASVTYRNDKPLFDTTKAVYKNDKPLFDTTKAVVSAPEKPLFDTAKAVYRNDKPLFDTTGAAAKVYRNDKPLYDTAVAKASVADTAATKPVAKARMEKKPAAVVKVQQTKDKDGETKIVYIDSSESPATVVTAYIAPEKAAPVTVQKEEAAKKEPVKAPVTTAVTEMPRQGEIRLVTERPAEKRGDTLTIILESPQMQRRDTVKLQKQEAPKPLYENKQVTEPVAETANNLGVGEVAKAERPEPVKAAEPVSEPVKNEPVKAEPVKTEPVKEAPVKAAEPEKKKLVMINSDCAGFATDADVDKLRVKMIAEKDVAKRVAVANKLFKTRCMTAKQIKGLSELFSTDETKYSFLSMAYPFAADTENFKELYQLFSEESYQTRFKTLVRY